MLGKLLTSALNSKHRGYCTVPVVAFKLGSECLGESGGPRSEATDFSNQVMRAERSDRVHS